MAGQAGDAIGKQDQLISVHSDTVYVAVGGCSYHQLPRPCPLQDTVPYQHETPNQQSCLWWDKMQPNRFHPQVQPDLGGWTRNPPCEMSPEAHMEGTNCGLMDPAVYITNPMSSLLSRQWSPATACGIHSNWWNEIPNDISTAESLNIFHRKLKTNLFRLYLA